MTFDAFHRCLSVFYKKSIYNEWIKENKTKHKRYVRTFIQQPILPDVPYELRNIPKSIIRKHPIQIPLLKCYIKELKLCMIKQCKLSRKSLFLNSCYSAANMLTK